MRVVQARSFGGSEVLEFAELPVPHPDEGEVRIRLVAAAVNPADAKRLAGSYGTPPPPPFRIGRELAGVVDAVGAGVDPALVGTERFGTVPDGSFAEFVIAEHDAFAVKPAAVSWEVAGGLALAGQTAWDELASQPVAPGDTVFVSAAAGGVGVLASQLLVARGVRVIGSASPGNHDFLAGLGVVPVAYGDGLAGRLADAAGDDGVQFAFDHHGAESIRAALAVGVPHERINTIAMDPAELGVRRVGRGSRSIATLDALAALVAAGDLVVPIEQMYAFEQVRAAFDRLAVGHSRGKIVLRAGA